MLAIKDVSIQRGHSTLFRQLNYSFDIGKIYCIQKGVLDGGSTLLHCFAALLQPNSGQVLYDDKDAFSLTPIELFKTVSYCYEASGLISIFTNYNNIAIPMHYHFDIAQNELHERIINVCEKLQIVDELKKEPFQLNDVHHRLFNLARALVVEPRLILIDEMQSGMSVEMRDKVLEVLFEERSRLGYTIIMTTTAGDDVSFADQLLMIKEQQLIEEAM